MIFEFQKMRHDHWPAVVMLFGVALAVRLFFFWRGFDYLRDSVFYVTMLREWAQGSFPAHRFCYFPFLPARLLMIGGLSAEAASGGFNLVTGSLIPVLFFLIFRQLEIRVPVSIGGGLIAALFPDFIVFSIQPMRECLFLFLALLALMQLIAIWKNGGMCHHVLFGFLCGISIFCRYEGAEWPVFYGFVLAAKLYRDRKNGSWKRIVFAAAGAFLMFSVAVCLAALPLVCDRASWEKITSMKQVFRK